MGGRRAPVLQRGVDEAADDAVAADDGAGDLRRDRVTRRSRWGRLWKPLSGSKQRWTVLFPSTAAAASTPWSNSRKACAIYTTTKKLPDQAADRATLNPSASKRLVRHTVARAVSWRSK